ncbi:hypothetical protein BDZ94DRAFT_1310503 [Collybia nuda]|uniref:Uncharacterized protein n=1 Tax=Collybia nuda TaxID=64659 RepID=A0A9P5Y4K6_9AGAR|nr:hypothetical protein BDZ94DRAFT_1310503 [Collybia nuda]
MSSHLVSLVPVAPLTDEVFSFNSKAILEIRDYQERDLGFLHLPPIQALANATGAVGDTAHGITHGIGDIARGSVGLFGQAVNSTPLFGGGLLGGAANLVGQTANAGINLAEGAADHLIDPTRTVRTHIKYSNNIQDHLPAAMRAADTAIRQFSEDMGNNAKDLFENTASKGIQVIVGLEGRLAVVTTALVQMNVVLTQDNVQEELKLGNDKYRGFLGTILHGSETHLLKEIVERLPLVIKTINDVGAAFTAIGANLRIAKEMIRAGVTDPSQIFAESLSDVEEAWRTYERKRGTLTYSI